MDNEKIRLEHIPLLESGPDRILEIMKYIKNRLKEECEGDVFIEEIIGDTADYATYARGFKLVQCTLLEKPIERKYLFGLIKKTKRHDEKLLLYGGADSNSLYVRLNDKNLIRICEEVLTKSRNPLSETNFSLTLLNSRDFEDYIFDFS